MSETTELNPEQLAEQIKKIDQIENVTVRQAILIIDVKESGQNLERNTILRKEIIEKYKSSFKSLFPINPMIPKPYAQIMVALFPTTKLKVKKEENPYKNEEKKLEEVKQSKLALEEKLRKEQAAIQSLAGEVSKMEKQLPEVLTTPKPKLSEPEPIVRKTIPDAEPIVRTFIPEPEPIIKKAIAEPIIASNEFEAGGIKGSSESLAAIGDQFKGSNDQKKNSIRQVIKGILSVTPFLLLSDDSTIKIDPKYSLIDLIKSQIKSVQDKKDLDKPNMLKIVQDIMSNEVIENRAYFTTSTEKDLPDQVRPNYLVLGDAISTYKGFLSDPSPSYLVDTDSKMINYVASLDATKIIKIKLFVSGLFAPLRTGKSVDNNYYLANYVGTILFSMIQTKNKDFTNAIENLIDPEASSSFKAQNKYQYTFDVQDIAALKTHYKDIFEFAESIVARKCQCGFRFPIPKGEKHHIWETYEWISYIMLKINIQYANNPETANMSFISCPEKREDAMAKARSIALKIKDVLNNRATMDSTRFLDALSPKLNNSVLKDFLATTDAISLEKYAEAQRLWEKVIICLNERCKKPLLKTPMFKTNELIFAILDGIEEGKGIMLYGNAGDGKSALASTVLDWFDWRYGIAYNILNVDESTTSYTLRGGFSPMAMSGKGNVSPIKYGVLSRCLLPPKFNDEVGNMVDKTGRNLMLDEINRCDFRNLAFMMGYFEKPYEYTLEEDNARSFHNPNDNTEKKPHWVFISTMNISDVGNESISLAFKSRFSMIQTKYSQAEMLAIVRFLMRGLCPAEATMFGEIFIATHSWVDSQSVVFPCGIRHYKNFFSQTRATFRKILEGELEDAFDYDETTMPNAWENTKAKIILSPKKVILFERRLRVLIDSILVMPLVDENNQQIVKRVKDEAFNLWANSFFTKIQDAFVKGQYPYLVK